MTSETDKRKKLSDGFRDAREECQEPKFRKPLTKIRNYISKTVRGRDDEDFRVEYITLENEWILLVEYVTWKDRKNERYGDILYDVKMFKLRRITKLRPFTGHVDCTSIIGCPVDPNSPFIQQLRLRAIEIPELKEKCTNASS